MQFRFSTIILMLLLLSQGNSAFGARGGDHGQMERAQPTDESEFVTIDLESGEEAKAARPAASSGDVVIQIRPSEDEGLRHRIGSQVEAAHLDTDEEEEVDKRKPWSWKSCLNYAFGWLNCKNSPYIKANIKFLTNTNYCTKCPKKRIAGIVGASALYGGSAVLFWQFGTGVFKGPVEDLAAFIVMNGYETAISFAAVFSGIPKNVPPTPVEKLRELAIIIPVHGKDKSIAETLETLYRARIDFSQIFIMENVKEGPNTYTQRESATYNLLYNTESPTYNPRYSRVNYFYTKKWGSKVAAEYLGAVSAKAKNFKYVMAIDDDVVMPDGFDPQLALIDGEVKLVTYPITPANNINYLTHMQKREYRQADRGNYLKQVLGTVIAPHGAVSVAEIDAYLDVMRKRPVDGAFFAEDQKKGHAFRWEGYQIAMAAGPPVKTEVPDNYMFHSAQRVRSWDLGAHLSTSIYCEDCVTDCPKSCKFAELTRVGIRKVFEAQEVMSNISDITRPIFFVSFASDPYFWTVVGALWEIKNIMNILDDVYLTPARNGQETCEGRKLATSCLDHHLSCAYVGMQMLNGTLSACCAYIGAGASDPDDYFILQPYPADLQRILNIRNVAKREKLLRVYRNENAPNVRGDIEVPPSPVGPLRYRSPVLQPVLESVHE